jgi:dihydrofolate reductase
MQRMAALVLKMSVSLDGYVAPADGSGGWIAAGGSEDALSWNVETVSNASAHLMGAATYAAMAAHWPSDSGPFARPMNEIPTVVFPDSLASRRLGRDDDRRRRPGRSHHAAQAGAFRRMSRASPT